MSVPLSLEAGVSIYSPSRMIVYRCWLYIGAIIFRCFILSMHVFTFIYLREYRHASVLIFNILCLFYNIFIDVLFVL